MSSLRVPLATLACIASLAHAADVTFSVSVPASTPAGDTVYIAGDFQGWNPGSPAYALTEQPDSTWEITLSLPDGAPIQFKFTRGSWGQVEKGPNGEEIANRTHTPSGTETIDLSVANWADVQPSTITGHVEWFEHAPFLGGRRCWVYLPPGYDESTESYPVLYMFDGQNLFDQATSFAGEWEIDEACEDLISNEEIEPIIVVGIENGQAARCNEYTPWADPLLPCTGGGADAHLIAIRNVLMPEVNARYRTKLGPEHSSIAGSSLGGVMASYAAYAHADTWGRAAALSTAYWAQLDLLDYALQSGRPPTLERLYQDMGSLEGATNLTALQQMHSIALGQGFTDGVDLLTVEAPGHQHNEFFWAARMPDILRFLIDPPTSCTDACDGDVNSDGAVDSGDIAYIIFRLDTCDPGGSPCPEGCDGDADGDGAVNTADIAFVIFRLGDC